MKLPIPKQTDTAHTECPFYCKDKSGDSGCIVKKISSIKLWENAVLEEHDNFTNIFNEDCEGQFDNCCFVDLLWKNGNDYGEEDVFDQNTEEKEEEMTMEIKVSVNKVDNPYLVKSDVLIYPANNLLDIDDILLNKMTRGKVQQECDKYQANVKMGEVYITSNGGDHIGGIKAQQVYHAVVAGESRLVNDTDIKSSIIKALMIADQNKKSVVSMLPADCGTHDIEQTAYIQLSAINDFLATVGVEHIKYIFIIMDDQDSYDIFTEQFSLIFAD